MARGTTSNRTAGLRAIATTAPCEDGGQPEKIHYGLEDCPRRCRRILKLKGFGAWWHTDSARSRRVPIPGFCRRKLWLFSNPSNPQFEGAPYTSPRGNCRPESTPGLLPRLEPRVAHGENQRNVVTGIVVAQAGVRKMPEGALKKECPARFGEDASPHHELRSEIHL
jgi:hypothetical protein